ncbi:hypothetical protein D3C80_2083670 [compost metagenome]
MGKQLALEQGQRISLSADQELRPGRYFKHRAADRRPRSAADRLDPERSIGERPVSVLPVHHRHSAFSLV